MNMKKWGLIVSVMLAAVLLTSCGKNKKTEDAFVSSEDMSVSTTQNVTEQSEQTLESMTETKGAEQPVESEIETQGAEQTELPTEKIITDIGGGIVVEESVEDWVDETEAANTTTKPTQNTTRPATTEATTPNTEVVSSATEATTPSTEAEEATVPPTENDQNVPSGSVSYEEYIMMDPYEQEVFFDSFSSLDAYRAWYNEAKAQYDAAQKETEGNIGGDLDIGDYIG